MHLLVAVLLAAAAPTEVFDLFVGMASALSENNPVAFMQAVDPALPGYDKFRDNVFALTAQCDVVSSVEFLKDEGNDTRRTVELDWLLEIHAKEDTSNAAVRRREVVSCRLERRGKKWKIVALEPASLFTPPPPKT